MNTQRLHAVAKKYNLPALAFEAYYDNLNTNVDPNELVDEFNEAYVGHYDCGLRDYAYELVNESVDNNSWLVINNYIDYEAIINDLERESYWEFNGHVFRPV